MEAASRHGRRRVAGLLAFLIAALVSADAQVRVVRRDDDRLRGIRRVDVLVKDLPDTPRCPLSRRDLQDAAVAALQASGLRATISEKASSWFYTVEVEVRSVSAGNQCVSLVAADLVAHVDGLPEADRGLPPDAWGSLLVGTMPLARESTMVEAAPADHPERITQALGLRLTAIGERVRLANR